MKTNKLKQLEDAAKGLNERREQVKAAIQAADEAVTSAAPGVSVWLDEPVLDGFQIGFAIAGEGWHLAARKSNKVMELAYAPFKVRLEALEHLDAVVDAIIEKARSHAENIDDKLEGIQTPRRTR